jgi:hypothetical protein
VVQNDHRSLVMFDLERPTSPHSARSTKADAARPAAHWPELPPAPAPAVSLAQPSAGPAFGASIDGLRSINFCELSRPGPPIHRGPLSIRPERAVPIDHALGLRLGARAAARLGPPLVASRLALPVCVPRGTPPRLDLLAWSPPGGPLTSIRSRQPGTSSCGGPSRCRVVDLCAGWSALSDLAQVEGDHQSSPRSKNHSSEQAPTRPGRSRRARIAATPWQPRPARLAGLGWLAGSRVVRLGPVLCGQLARMSDLGWRAEVGCTAGASCPPASWPG